MYFRHRALCIPVSPVGMLLRWPVGFGTYVSSRSCCASSPIHRSTPYNSISSNIQIVEGQRHQAAGNHAVDTIIMPVHPFIPPIRRKKAVLILFIIPLPLMLIRGQQIAEIQGLLHSPAYRYYFVPERTAKLRYLHAPEIVVACRVDTGTSS